MGNLIHILHAQCVPTDSYIAAAIHCNQTNYSKDKYDTYISQLVGISHHSDDEILAKLTWGYIAQYVVRRERVMTSLDVPINPKVVLEKAVVSATELRYGGKNAWMWAQKLSPTDTNVPNAPKKKGWKKIRALDIFNSNPTMPKQDFIKQLVAELDMTPSGAQTYYYDILREQKK